jgi:pyroglutamyl-peptidase
MTTILLTGFGPFPGAPVNPTGPLVHKLARGVRISRVHIIGHVFETSYAAVDRELPKLLARHKPDVLLSFGLALRARLVRVETQARNVVTVVPDVTGKTPQRRTIVPGAPATLAMPAPTRTMFTALRKVRVPATLSRDAGGYLCNYLCWRAAEAVATQAGPRLAAFIHVPPVRAGARTRLSLDDLVRGGGRVLAALAAAARR